MAINVLESWRKLATESSELTGTPDAILLENQELRQENRLLEKAIRVQQGQLQGFSALVKRQSRELERVTASYEQTVDSMEIQSPKRSLWFWRKPATKTAIPEIPLVQSLS